MTLDTRARATAQRLLAKFGKACAIRHIDSRGYDPETGTVATLTMQAPIYVSFESPNQKDFGSGQIIGLKEMSVFAAKGLPFDPTPGDIIMTCNNLVDDWFEYYFGIGTLIDNYLQSYATIATVSKVWSGEQVALWRCGLKS